MRVGVFLYFDNDPHTVSVGFVVDIRNAFETLILDVIGNGFDKFMFVYLIREFGYDNSLSRTVVELFDFASRAENVTAPARSVSVSYTASAHYYAARGIIGSGNIFKQIVYS